MSARWIYKAPVILALAALAAMPARSLAQAQVEADRTKKPADDAPVLQVVNNNWLDVHVYVSRASGPLVSLGMVTTFNTREFKLPADAVDAAAGLRIVADPIGGSDIYVSPDVLASAGSEVVVTLQNSLPLSFVSVRPKAVGEGK